MPFRLSSRSRAWFGNVALPEAPRGHEALRWLLVTCVACSAPDASDLFVPLSSNGGSDGASGVGGAGSDAPDASTPTADGGGREGQGGTLNLAGAGGDAGNASAGPPLLDAGFADAADAAAPASDAGEEPPGCVAQQEVCDGLDNDCDSVSDQGATCVTECDGFALDGHGYMFCSSAVSRPEAIGRCQLEGMHLVWIDSEEEQAALIANIAAADVPLPAGNPEILTQIGASDAATEGVWRWVGTDSIADSYQFWQGGAAAQGGATVLGAFASWDNTEPNNGNGEDCALMSVLGGGGRAVGAWDDRGCEATFPFACERD